MLPNLHLGSPRHVQPLTVPSQAAAEVLDRGCTKGAAKGAEHALEQFLHRLRGTGGSELAEATGAGESIGHARRVVPSPRCDQEAARTSFKACVQGVD